MLNTKDIDELNHFSSLSADWWNESGPFKVLHEITPCRIAFIKEKLCQHFSRDEASLRPLEGLRILDVGCGGGLLCEPLTRLGAEVTGIDPIQGNIDLAIEHAQAMNLKISYLPYAIEDLPPYLPPFDAIIASEILEHVADQDGFLKACHERLQPQGGMVITTLNKTLKSYLCGILLAEHVLGWAPKGTHSWDKFVTPETLSKKLLTLGFSSQDIRGLTFSPLSRTWTLSYKTDVNYFLWASRH